MPIRQPQPQNWVGPGDVGMVEREKIGWLREKFRK